MNHHICLLGATGATGRLVMQQLLQRNCFVTAIVRNKASLDESMRRHPQVTFIEAEISHLTVNELADQLTDCDTVISCLGHRLSFSGIWGKPRRLVTDAIEKSVAAIRQARPHTDTKIILMNTVGNAHRGIPEKPPFSQRAVVWLLRYLVPPHADNEQAAEFLRKNIENSDNSDNSDNHLSYVIVRPDSLTNDDHVSDYTVHPSPTRNAIFNSGRTSRINVANFMAELTTNNELWQQWQGHMPVIYNTTDS
jgi:nucleoside-diphosphate-sugar epimerase